MNRYSFLTQRVFYTYLYASVQWPPDAKADDGFLPVSYDLDKEPEDICLKVFGADEAHVVFTSNTVVIPKQIIANALAAAH
jgi:hypothetical protein